VAGYLLFLVEVHSRRRGFDLVGSARFIDLVVRRWRLLCHGAHFGRLTLTLPASYPYSSKRPYVLQYCERNRWGPLWSVSIFGS